MIEWSTLKKLIWQRAALGKSLPDGYKRVIGFKCSGDTYYKITDVKLSGSDTVKFSISVTASCNIFGCYTNTSATDNYSLYVSTSSGGKYLRYNGGAYKSYWASSALDQRFDITITPTGSYGMPSGQDDTWKEIEFAGSVDMCIGTTSTGATSAKLKGNLYDTFRVIDSTGENKFYGIPCERLSDNALGYYDTVSETFFEPTGTAPVSLGYS